MVLFRDNNQSCSDVMQPSPKLGVTVTLKLCLFFSLEVKKKQNMHPVMLQRNASHEDLHPKEFPWPKTRI